MIKTLKEIQDSFEDRLVEGLHAEIVAYKPGEEYPIGALIKINRGWSVIWCTEEGRYVTGCEHPKDLIPKRKTLDKEQLKKEEKE